MKDLKKLLDSKVRKTKEMLTPTKKEATPGSARPPLKPKKT